MLMPRMVNLGAGQAAEHQAVGPQVIKVGRLFIARRVVAPEEILIQAIMLKQVPKVAISLYTLRVGAGQAARQGIIPEPRVQTAIQQNVEPVGAVEERIPRVPAEQVETGASVAAVVEAAELELQPVEMGGMVVQDTRL